MNASAYMGDQQPLEFTQQKQSQPYLRRAVVGARLIGVRRRVHRSVAVGSVARGLRISCDADSARDRPRSGRDQANEAALAVPTGTSVIAPPMHHQYHGL